jgi:hypothetical protein
MLASRLQVATRALVGALAIALLAAAAADALTW